ncbi:hypothetical protein OG339_37625 [Streptosporangium sp. NBC_01495]|uniref:hypothetical protein n=1 Tax=Streptosporangium sp. NBC_01495 TaxID=2903899 RepID=UPI002E353ADC|nr:hypothetical protein [Streptosporangium sp. NBC_01495]
MTVYGWVILDDTAATKRVNGQDVIVTTGGSGDIRVAVRAWEDSEHHRLLRDLANLARLVDGALTRPQLHHTPNDRRNPTQEIGMDMRGRAAGG